MIFPSKPLKATSNQRFKIFHLSKNSSFLNCRSAVQSCPWSPVQIKRTQSSLSLNHLHTIHADSHQFTTFHESYMGKTRGKRPCHFSFHNNDHVWGDSMAKRFTDTAKWRKPWFRSLHLKAKTVWGYITDNCDHAGIWPAAFDLMSGDVGFKVSASDLELWFGDKIISLGDRYFIPSFISFQYGELQEDSKPHQSVIKIVTHHGIDPKNLTLYKEYPKGMGTLKDKDKNKDKDKDKEDFCFSKDNVTDELESLYRVYPRKEGKALGIKRLLADIKAGARIEDISSAVAAYRARCAAAKTEPKYIKLFSTFATHWRECLDDDYGNVESFSQSSESSFTGVADV